LSIVATAAAGPSASPRARPTILRLRYSGRRLRAIVTGFEIRVMDSQTYGPKVLLLAPICLRVLAP